MSNMLSMFGGGQTTNQPLVGTGYTGTPNPAVSQAYSNTLSNYGNLLNQYGSLYNQAGANQGGYVQSVVDPTIQTNAQLYGGLLSDQALRGIRGSSFGDQSLSNFSNAANTNVANQTANALQQSLGLQSGILGNMGQLNQAMGGTAGGLGQYLNQITGQGLNYNLGMLANNRAGAAQNAGMFGGLMNQIGPLLRSLFSGGGGTTGTDYSSAGSLLGSSGGDWGSTVGSLGSDSSLTGQAISSGLSGLY